MERKLKDFFSRRKHSRQRNNVPDSPRAGPVEQKHQIHAEPPPPTRATDRVHHASDPVPEPEVPSGMEAEPVTQPEPHSNSRYSSVSSPSPKHNSNRSSISGNTNTIPNRRPSRGSVLTNQVVPDDNIAENYTAYLPALTPQYMTLGGDTRLMHNPGERQHSEDVADRNIHASLNPQESPRRGSYARYEDFERFTGRFGTSHPDQSSVNSQTGSVNSAFYASNQSNKTPRSEISMQWRRRRSGVKSDGGDINDNAPRMSDYGPRNTVDMKDHVEPTPVKNMNMDGASDDVMEGGAVQPVSAESHSQLHPDTNKIVNLSDTVDVDKTTSYAPAVTHEIIKPHTHEIITEEIHRTIHNHSVYHYIQPVYSLEILPTRHFVLSSTDPPHLIEIPESQIPPSSTPENQRWYIGTRPVSPSAPTSKFFTGERRREPVVVDDKSYMTDQGFERRETTILYPPTLEDMSGYEGLVLPIHFDDKGGVKEERMCRFGKAGVDTTDKKEGANGIVERKEHMSDMGKKISTSQAIHRKPVPTPKPHNALISSSPSQDPEPESARTPRKEEHSGVHDFAKTSEPARQDPPPPQRRSTTSTSLSISARKQNHRLSASASRWIDTGPSTHARFEKVAAA